MEPGRPGADVIRDLGRCRHSGAVRKGWTLVLPPGSFRTWSAVPGRLTINAPEESY